MSPVPLNQLNLGEYGIVLVTGGVNCMRAVAKRVLKSSIFVVTDLTGPL